MMIQELFDRVAVLKYPDGTFNSDTRSMQRAFCHEIYVAFGRAVETGMLDDKSVEETAIYCAVLKLQGPGGTEWTRDDAAQKVKEIAAELAVTG